MNCVPIVESKVIFFQRLSEALICQSVTLSWKLCIIPHALAVLQHEEFGEHIALIQKGQTATQFWKFPMG